MAIELRPYQADVVGEFELIPDGEKALVVAPTGSGKTVIAAAIIANQVARTVLFLAHRREIIKQTSAKLFAQGINHGVIMPGVSPRPMESVQVASIQTLWSRGMRSDAMQMPSANLLVIDECHHARANTYQKIIDAYPNATLLGLTATPCRGDGRGLGNVFTKLIECPQVAELIEQGHLVKSRVYAPVDPNLSGVKTQNGDYIVSQLSNRMNTHKLVGDIVTHWYKYGERRKTVVFAVDVKHSVHITEEFCKAGVRAEHLDGSTPTAERDANLARLGSGETEVVSNCMVLTEGWDMPAIGCLILARPTKQMGLFRQMIGRGLRPAEGKTDAIILDHSGAVYRHGLPEDRVEWTLDTDKRASNPTHEGRRNSEHGSRLLECTQCSAIRTAGEPCPCCGFLPKPPPRYVPFEDGDLGRVVGDRARAPQYDQNEWLGMLRHIADARGYKPGWVAHKFKEKFHRFPPFGSIERVTPIPPSNEVNSWVRSRLIAFMKASAA
jgi:DNA repair protein RadD